MLYDASETLTGEFRLFTVYDRLKDLPNFQIKLTNNTGGIADRKNSAPKIVPMIE